MLSQKARRFFHKLGIKLIAASLIMLGLIFLADLSFRPVAETVNAYECHAIVYEIINSAIAAELENNGTDYSSLVNLTTNSEGEVISLESNVVNINRLKTAVAQRVQREIRRISAIDIYIPIGTLSGIKLFHGKGFKVGMRVQPLGYATTSIISEFTEAGINQTCHRIIIEVSADVDAIVPWMETRTPVKTTIVAAETVIMGRVPEAYTHVVSQDSDLIGTLQDYGAVL